MYWKKIDTPFFVLCYYHYPIMIVMSHTPVSNFEVVLAITIAITNAIAVAVFVMRRSVHPSYVQ